jgi:hypothetical protein
VRIGPQTVVADDERHASAIREINVQPGNNRVDLRLGEGAALGGRVVDGAGNPVAGATIALGLPARAEISDGGGAFRFTGLESGTYTVTARKDGYASARREVQLSGRPVEGLELRLEQGGGVITGRITGLAPALLAQLEVRAMAVPLTSMDGIREGRADAGGAYRVEGVHAGTWVVAARHTSGREARKEVTVAEGARQTQLDLDFGAGARASGVVVDEVTRAPLAGVVVSAGSARTISKPDGTFALTNLGRGTHRLTATLDGYEPADVTVEIVSDDGSVDGVILGVRPR